MLIGGPGRRQQQYRRRTLAALADLRDETVDAMVHPPLPPGRASVNPIEEPYGAALEAALARTDTPAVLTGVGGDELLALRPEERRPGPVPAPRAREYLSAEVRELGETGFDRPDDAPVSVLPKTAMLANLVRAPIFLRAGRWPVAPLCDPDLVRFCEWLPAPWRVDKRLAREWMIHGMSVPEDVAWPRLRENFGTVMQLGLATSGLDHLRSMLARGSALCRPRLRGPGRAA